MFESIKANVEASGGDWTDFVRENSGNLLLLLSGSGPEVFDELGDSFPDLDPVDFATSVTNSTNTLPSSSITQTSIPYSGRFQAYANYIAFPSEKYGPNYVTMNRRIREENMTENTTNIGGWVAGFDTKLVNFSNSLYCRRSSLNVRFCFVKSNINGPRIFTHIEYSPEYNLSKTPKFIEWNININILKDEFYSIGLEIMDNIGGRQDVYFPTGNLTFQTTNK